MWRVTAGGWWSYLGLVLSVEVEENHLSEEETQYLKLATCIYQWTSLNDQISENKKESADNGKNFLVGISIKTALIVSSGTSKLKWEEKNYRICKTKYQK